MASMLSQKHLCLIGTPGSGKTTASSRWMGGAQGGGGYCWSLTARAVSRSVCGPAEPAALSDVARSSLRDTVAAHNVQGPAKLPRASAPYGLRGEEISQNRCSRPIHRPLRRSTNGFLPLDGGEGANMISYFWDKTPGGMILP